MKTLTAADTMTSPARTVSEGTTLDEAEWVAWSARGVTDVKNELEVKARAFVS